MTVVSYLLLILSVFIGSALAFWLKDMTEQYLKLGLAFSGAFLLGITVLHLLPGIYTGDNHMIGIWILLGFLIQLFLEFLSGGLEHGHVHAHNHHVNSFLLQVMVGLIIHSFIEGLPLDNYQELHAGHNHGPGALLYGIVLHKIPAAFALTLFMIQSKLSKGLTFLILFIFAMASPLGSFVGSLIELNEQGLQILLAVVVGSFLHIATVILFENEDEHHHKFSWSKFLVILLGFGIAIGASV